MMQPIRFAPETMTPREYLHELARQFQRAPRQGQPVDDPEGVRYITMSDTLAQQIAQQLSTIADKL